MTDLMENCGRTNEQYFGFSYFCEIFGGPINSYIELEELDEEIPIEKLKIDPGPFWEDQVSLPWD
jgi:hypothetical protein